MPQNRRTAIGLTLLSLGFVLQAAGLQADFTLLSSNQTKGRQVFALEYQASSAHESMDWQVPEALAEIGREIIIGDLPAVDPPAQKDSCLLAVPSHFGTTDETWTISVQGDSPAIAPEGAFQLQLVRVGPYPALSVLADLELAGQTTWHLTVTGPPLPTDEKNYLEFSEDAIGPAVFLNGAPPPVLRDALTKQVFEAPAPIPPMRHAYTAGERAIVIPVPADLSRFRVSYHGQTVAIHPIGGGEALVYLPARMNIATDRQDVIFIDDDSDVPSPQMGSRPAFLSLTPGGVEVAVPRSRVYDEPAIFERNVPLPVGQRLVKFRVSRTQTMPNVLAFPDRLSTPTVTARVQMAGLTTVPSVFPHDHFSQFALGGVTSPEVFAWKGRILKEVEFAVDLPSLLPGGAAQTLTLSHTVPTVAGAIVDQQNQYGVELLWTGYPRVGTDNRLVLDMGAEVPAGKAAADKATGPQLATVAGFPVGTTLADLLVMDVTNPLSPMVLDNPTTFSITGGLVGVEFEVPTTPTMFLVQLRSTLGDAIEPAASATMPVVVTEYTNRLQGIYVCPAPLRASLQPLLDHRGPGFHVLDPEAAYNAYSHGQESPESIRKALGHIVGTVVHRKSFPSVILVGHATFDWRNRLGFATAPQVPTFIEESINVGFTIENCIDFPYGNLFGDDDYIDSTVARLPVKSAAELDHMVARILAFEADAEELFAMDRPALFVYDDDPAFDLDQPTWATLWSATERGLDTVLTIPPTDGQPENAQVRAYLGQAPRGPAMVMYVGHGNNTVWAAERVLKGEEIADIDTLSGYPFVSTFTCLNAYYAFPNAASRSMGELWLLAPLGRGASANYSPGSVDYYSVQRLKMEVFMQLMASPTRPETVGELATLTRLIFAVRQPSHSITNREYLLFGDPQTPTTIPHVFPARNDDWMQYD